MKIQNILYKRVLLKISGEALQGKNNFGIDSEMVAYIASELKSILDHKVQVGLIIGGGNFLRGAEIVKYGLDRVTSDQMGMIATMINSLAVRDIFQHHQINTTIMSAIPCPGLIDQYDREKALAELINGRLLILAGGSGNPLVTTDTALSLRGIELKADILLKATKVDGVYSADPNSNKDAQKLEKVSFQEALAKELKVMDLISFSLCRDHNMVLRVFNINKKGALLNIVLGGNEGTVVTNEVGYVR